MMSEEEFLALAKAEQDKWVNPVGRLILAAASIERSVNELLNVLEPEASGVWRKKDFFTRAGRISDISKKELSDTLAAALKDQKRKYWPVMESRNAIAHNPLFMHAFGQGPDAVVSATILHQQKDMAYNLADIRKFADEADAVSADLMQFAANFPIAHQREIDLAHSIFTAMHLRRPEEGDYLSAEVDAGQAGIVDAAADPMKVAFEAKYNRDWEDPSGDEMKAIWADAWAAAKADQTGQRTGT
ncbi:hypothetical protein LJR118_006575 [Acidovorax sp. LjRoot118]|uniref:hypothetical protein n=1 Tax=Acidovorax sp. LjRoot118 TaxID=3342256 RepID=UPI003ECE801D